MSNKIKIKGYRAWFYSRKPLQEIGDFLVREQEKTDYTYDYENIYEWIEIDKLNSGYSLNISRKHNDWKEIEKEPTTLFFQYSSLEPGNDLIENIATDIGRFIQTEVFLGTVKHVGADEFEYSVDKRINS
ncbi:MAG: hypothetical protein AAF587_13615 [Bacteroidota bacterium]